MSQVQVLMPARNCQEYVEEAVHSIINQTYNDLQLLVMDDGSTDNTSKILQSLAKKHSKLELFTRSNRGVVSTLNELVSLSDAPYIARMDADDIACKDRITKQMKCLTKNRLDVVGSWVQLFGAENAKWHFREHDNLCRAQSLFGRQPQLQGALLCNRHVFDQTPFRNKYEHVEDIDFMMRVVSNKNYRIGCAREFLLHYRRYPESVSSSSNLRDLRYKRQFLEILPEHMHSMGIALDKNTFNDFVPIASLISVNASEFAKATRAMQIFIETAGKMFNDLFFEFNYRWLIFCKMNLDASQVLDAYRTVFPSPSVTLVDERQFRANL